jgi:hypothetical protein
VVIASTRAEQQISLSSAAGHYVVEQCNMKFIICAHSLALCFSKTRFHVTFSLRVVSPNCLLSFEVSEPKYRNTRFSPVLRQLLETFLQCSHYEIGERARKGAELPAVLDRDAVPAP